MTTIGSLFSGIGGLDLGLEMAGLGPTLWQVEQNPFCRIVLAKHWPSAERFTDVREVGRANLSPVDLVCGGFPCQDVSSAGKGAGLAGERSGLWREFARVVGEIRPRWVVVENVASGAGRWLDAVVRELEELGYAVLPCPVSARDVGAPHRRERLFIVAHADRGRELQPQGGVEGIGRRVADSFAADVDGVPSGQSRRGESGGTGSTVAGDSGQDRRAPDTAELGGVTRRPDVRSRKSHTARDTSTAPDVDDTRREGPGPGEQDPRREGSPAYAWRPLESDVVPLVHGLRGGLAGRRRRARIRALGNAVVPQCAEVVGWVIRELMAAEVAA